jgi:hypothetical protein
MRKTFACPFVLGETSHCPQSHVMQAPEIDEIATGSRELPTLSTMMKILRGGTVYP